MLLNPNIFQALADPTRLRIIDAMRAGELAVNDLVAQVDIQQSGVSRHLRILQEAGLVAMRPVGQRRLYSLQRAQFDALGHWLAAYRLTWDSRLDRLDTALDRRSASRAAAQRETANRATANGDAASSNDSPHNTSRDTDRPHPYKEEYSA